MFTIALLQGKGGTGKTTTAINLAGALVEHGAAVTVADLDPQQSAVGWPGADTALAGRIHALGTEGARREFAKISKGADFVVIDTPPTLTTKEPMIAAALADLLIVPCLAGAQEYQRADKTLSSVEVFDKPYRLLASMIDTREVIGRQARATLATRGPTFNTHIAKAVAMREAVFAGQWIGEYAPNSVCHRQFQDLTREIIAITE